MRAKQARNSARDGCLARGIGLLGTRNWCEFIPVLALHASLCTCFATLAELRAKQFRKHNPCFAHVQIHPWGCAWCLVLGAWVRIHSQGLLGTGICQRANSKRGIGNEFGAKEPWPLLCTLANSACLAEFAIPKHSAKQFQPKGCVVLNSHASKGCKARAKGRVAPFARGFLARHARWHQNGKLRYFRKSILQRKESDLKRVGTIYFGLK